MKVNWNLLISFHRRNILSWCSKMKRSKESRQCVFERDQICIILKFLQFGDLLNVTSVSSLWNECATSVGMLKHVFGLSTSAIDCITNCVIGLPKNLGPIHHFVSDNLQSTYFPDVRLSTVFISVLTDCCVVELNDYFEGAFFSYFDATIRLNFSGKFLQIRKELYYFNFGNKFIRYREKQNTLLPGHYFRFLEKCFPQIKNVRLFPGKKQIHLFTRNCMEELVQCNSVIKFDEFQKFLTTMNTRDEILGQILNQSFVRELPNLRDLPLGEAIRRLLANGLIMEQQMTVVNASDLRTQNLQPRQLQDQMFHVGFDVLQTHQQQHFSFTTQFKNRYPQCNSSLFLVDNPAQGIRDFDISNSNVTTVQFMKEMTQFDEAHVDEFPSKFCPLFIQSGCSYVVEYLLHLLQREMPTVWRSLSLMVRHVHAKELKILGVISSLIGAWKKQSRFMQKYFHMVLIAVGGNNPTFRILNQVQTFCYYDKIPDVIRNHAITRIASGKRVNVNSVLRIGGDNCSKTNMWSNPPGKQVHSVTTGFNTSPAQFTFKGKVFKDRILKIEEMECGVTETVLLTLQEQGRQFFYSYITNRKRRYSLEFEPNTTEFFVLEQFLAETYSVDIIASYFSKIFSTFTFEDILKTLILFHADFQFYTVSCRLWNSKTNVKNILCLLGALHYEMSVCDCIWKIFNSFFLNHLNELTKLKCPPKFSSSKYPRFKKLIIITILSVKNVLKKIGLQFSQMKNINNYQLKVLLLFDFLGNLYGSYMRNVRNNNFGEVLKLYDVFQGFFWVLHKTNYNIGNFEQRIHFKMMVEEAYEWILKNRFLTFRFPDSHIGYDMLIEIFNCIIKNEIVITGHDEESLRQWSQLVPILFYIIFNERKEFVHYCRNKRRSSPSASAHVRKKWIIEEQVEIVTAQIWRYLCRSFEFKPTPQQLFDHPCHWCLFSFEMLRRDPLIIYEKYLKFETTQKWQKWVKRNVEAYNKKGTCFVTPPKKRQTETDVEETEQQVPATLLDQLFDRDEFVKNLEVDQDFDPNDSDEEDELEEEEIDNL